MAQDCTDGGGLPDLDQRLAEPESSTTDGLTVKNPSIDKIIEADKYLRKVCRKGAAFNVTLIKSPGATGR